MHLQSDRPCVKPVKLVEVDMTFNQIFELVAKVVIAWIMVGIVAVATLAFITFFLIVMLRWAWYN